MDKHDVILTGAEAIAQAAFDVGCDFFASSPQPFTAEITDAVSRVYSSNPHAVVSFLPSVQDTIPNIIGASWAGRKSLAAVYSIDSVLEELELAISTETPCVITAIEKTGLSIGQPTRLSQSQLKLLQNKAIAQKLVILSAWSVSDLYECVGRAFDISESLRVPVVILCQSALINLYENFKPKKISKITERNTSASNIIYGAYKGDKIAPMPVLGSGSKIMLTADTHDARGFRRSLCPDTIVENEEWLCEKIVSSGEDIAAIDSFQVSDAKAVVISFGLCARSCYDTVKYARSEKINLGLIRLKSLAPLPVSALQKACNKCEKIFVCEMDRGILKEFIQKIFPDKKIISINKINGEMIFPDEILEKIKSEFDLTEE